MSDRSGVALQVRGLRPQPPAHQPAPRLVPLHGLQVQPLLRGYCRLHLRLERRNALACPRVICRHRRAARLPHVDEHRRHFSLVLPHLLPAQLQVGMQPLLLRDDLGHRALKYTRQLRNGRRQRVQPGLQVLHHLVSLSLHLLGLACLL